MTTKLSLWDSTLWVQELMHNSLPNVFLLKHVSRFIGHILTAVLAEASTESPMLLLLCIIMSTVVQVRLTWGEFKLPYKFYSVSPVGGSGGMLP